MTNSNDDSSLPPPPSLPTRVRQTSVEGLEVDREMIAQWLKDTDQRNSHAIKLVKEEIEKLAATDNTTATELLKLRELSTKLESELRLTSEKLEKELKNASDANGKKWTTYLALITLISTIIQNFIPAFTPRDPQPTMPTIEIHGER